MLIANKVVVVIPLSLSLKWPRYPPLFSWHTCSHPSVDLLTPFQDCQSRYLAQIGGIGWDSESRIQRFRPLFSCRALRLIHFKSRRIYSWGRLSPFTLVDVRIREWFTILDSEALYKEWKHSLRTGEYLFHVDEEKDTEGNIDFGVGKRRCVSVAQTKVILQHD